MRILKISQRLIGLIVIFLLLESGFSYGSMSSYQEILDKAGEVNGSLNTFIAKLDIEMHFLGLKFPLKANLYYKKPDKVRLIVPSLPNSLKSKKSFFREMVPRSFHHKDYNGKVAGKERLSSGEICYILKLTPKEACKIERVDLWVDKDKFVPCKTVIYYKDGSKLFSLQNYRRESSYILPNQQSVLFEFPAFKASTTVKYTSYQINASVDTILKI